MSSSEPNRRGASKDDQTPRKQERLLIAKALRGEPVAMRKLIDLHKDRLFAFVRRMIRNHHDAEEVTQDAFLRAFASLDSFSTEYRFSTWLFTIAYRLCLNVLRKKQSLTGDVDFSLLPGADAPYDATAAESEEAARLKRVIWNAVDQLSPPQKAAVVLFYRHGHSCQDISAILELPVATVKSHLHRARGRLKDQLQPVVADEGSQLRILGGLAG
jgi:RNA polymerase sigma-70 factor (ECF subfamily)